MIEKQLDELFPEMTLNTNSRVRKKCLVVYLRKKGYRRVEVAELLRIDEDTVSNYTKNYDESGLPGLLEENYHQPKSQLEPYTEQLKELFKGCSLNLKQPQQKERQRDLFFAKTVSIFEQLKLMTVNLRCQLHQVVSSAYRQDKISVL
jgi:transposase